MSVEEFASGAARSGILTDREIVSLFLYFTVNPKPAVNFQDNPRCSMTGKEQSVNRQVILLLVEVVSGSFYTFKGFFQYFPRKTMLS